MALSFLFFPSYFELVKKKKKTANHSQNSMTTPKKAPKAMLHNYFYSPLPGSIKITQLCKIAAQPDAPNATATALRI